MEDGYYSSDMATAYGMGALKAATKEMFGHDNFSMKLLKLQMGKKVFIPIILVPDFIRYLGHKKVRNAKMQSNGKDGMIFSTPENKTFFTSR